MRNNLTPAQRREKWILVFIFFILLGINIGFLGNPNPIVPGLNYMVIVVMWTWIALRTPQANSRPIRNLVWIGLAIIGLAGGVMLLLWITHADTFLWWGALVPATIGLGYLIASGIRLWQVRRSGLR